MIFLETRVLCRHGPGVLRQKTLHRRGKSQPENVEAQTVVATRLLQKVVRLAGLGQYATLIRREAPGWPEAQEWGAGYGKPAR